MAAQPQVAIPKNLRQKEIFKKIINMIFYIENNASRIKFLEFVSSSSENSLRDCLRKEVDWYLEIEVVASESLDLWKEHLLVI